jgi:hypothetical protein
MLGHVRETLYLDLCICRSGNHGDTKRTGHLDNTNLFAVIFYIETGNKISKSLFHG